MKRSHARRRLGWSVLMAAALTVGALAALVGGPGGPAASGAPDVAGEPLWQPVREGLHGDIVAEMALVGRPPSNVRSMLLVPEGRGLYRASDDGSSWDAVLPDPDRASAVVYALTVGRGDAEGHAVYAGLQGRTRFARSEDGGRTWVALPGPTFVNRVDRLTTSEATGRVYAAQSDRPTLYTSLDGGEVWSDHPLPGGAVPLKAFLTAPDDPVVYMIRGDVLYRTNDDPAQWSIVLRPDPSPPVTVALAVDLAAIGPRGRLHAAGRLSSGHWRVRTSDDRGEHWVGEGWPEGAEGLTPTAIGAGEMRPGLNGVWLALDDGRVFESDDRGVTWRTIATLPIRGTRIAVDPYFGDVWVGTDGLGLYRVKPEPVVHTGAVPVNVLGVHAAVRPTDTATTALLLAEVLPERRGLSVTLPPLFGVFESEGGLAWALRYLTGGLGTELVASPGAPSAVKLYSGRKVSTDMGDTFLDLAATPGGKVPYVLSVGPITGTLPVVYAIEEPYAPGLGGQGMVLSEDGGATWQPIDTLPVGIVDVVASPAFADDRTAFAVSHNGFVYAAEDGLTFRLVGRIPSYDPIERNVHDLAISPAYPQDGTLLAAVEDTLAAPRANVYLSNTRGRTWQSRTEGLDGSARPRHLSLSPQFATDRVVFLGAERTAVDPPLPGVFASDSGGADWFAEAFFPPSSVRSFAWVGLPGEGTLFAAGGLAGLWVRDLGEPIGGAVPTQTIGPGPATGTASPSATLEQTATPGTALATPTATATPTGDGGTAPATASATDATPSSTSATPTEAPPTPTHPLATATETPIATATSSWPPTDEPMPAVAYLPALVKRR